MNNYRSLSESMRSDLVGIRRRVHENPELGFEEFETAKLIKAELDALGVSYRSEIARTGIIATIEGSRPGKTLLIRADMDALPMIEDADLEFKSKNDGVFHACGHDTHVTCLLGTAKILQQNRDKFGGKVLLVFQPAEEGSKVYDPTGKIAGGALPMVMEAGDVLNPDNLDGVLALHIVSGEEPEAQVGKIGVGDGPFTGSADEIFVDIIGKGGHASAPHAAIDPVYIASQVNVAIQGWLTRYVDPMEPVVITFGKIAGGFRQNIISEKCRMEGTLRTLNEDLRNRIKEKLPELIKGIAQAFGGDAETVIHTGYPVGVNDKEMNDHVRSSTKEMYGEDALVEVSAQLGAEDFYEFGFKNKVPITMFWLGGANVEKGWVGHNHSNYFAIDEDALPMGTAVLAASAMSFLS